MSKQAEEINIQDECMKIHHQYGTSEMANYKIQLLAESFAQEQVKKSLEEERERVLREVERVAYIGNVVCLYKIKEILEL